MSSNDESTTAQSMPLDIRYSDLNNKFHVDEKRRKVEEMDDATLQLEDGEIDLEEHVKTNGDRHSSRHKERSSRRSPERGRSRDRYSERKRDRPRSRDHSKERSRERSRDRRKHGRRDKRDRSPDYSRSSKRSPQGRGRDKERNHDSSHAYRRPASPPHPPSLPSPLPPPPPEEPAPPCEEEPDLSKMTKAELALYRRQQEVKKMREMQQSRYKMYDSIEVDSRERQRELENIKKEKLGIKETQRLYYKKAKNKLVFDWDPGEDTTDYSRSLYTEKDTFRPQFGRGFIAGVDKSIQIKDYRNKITSKERSIKQSKNTLSSDTIDAMKRDRQLCEQLLNQVAKKEKKNAHWREKEVHEMTSRDWRIFREDYNITCKGGTIPNPIRCWPEMDVPKWLLDAIDSAGYRSPTPIQMQAIPIGLLNRDMVGVAETGSGKTVAFLLPMLTYISKLPPLDDRNKQDGPYALILAPNRELALQIEEDANKLASFGGYRVVSLVGGQSIENQAMLLRKGCEILVATPGRLVDFLERRYTVLNQCNYVILDEGDRMIDLGFEQQLLAILDSMPQETMKSIDEVEAEKQESDKSTVYRTTVLFSATMPPTVERMAQRYLRRPAYVYIGHAGKTVDRIKQTILFNKGFVDKRRNLMRLIETGPPPPIIVFCNLKNTCDDIAKILKDQGHRVSTLHSGKSQDQRLKALNDFKEGSSDILICTDVASRGIHVEGVTHVINFDLPNNIEDYTHRIGRTGRAGGSGIATSLLTSDDVDIMFDLRQMLEKTGNNIPPELENHPAAQQKKGGTASTSRRETIIYIQ